MIKIGIFVEGLTERLFVEKFLSEYLGGLHTFSLKVEKHRGKKGTELIYEKNYPYAEYYFLIFDVSGDGSVNSALIDRATHMIRNQKFQYLLALKDLYPAPRNKKQLVIDAFWALYSKEEKRRNFQFQDKINLALAIMEVEAWFLADPYLFSRIFLKATPEYINEKLGIDLTRNPELHDHPAAIIDKIYRALRGEKYGKHTKEIYEIVNKLDYDFLYCKAVSNIPSWNHFLDCIENAL